MEDKVVTINTDISAMKTEESAPAAEPIEVVKATGTKKKTGIAKAAEGFLGDNLKNVGRYLVKDVIIPELKAFTLSLVEGLLYQNSRPAVPPRGVPYASYYSNPAIKSAQSPGRTASKLMISGRAATQKATECSDVLFDTKDKAAQALDCMKMYIAQKGNASIADFARITDSHSEWTDTYYGWRNLDIATVSRDRDTGLYFIDFPRAIDIR